MPDRPRSPETVAPVIGLVVTDVYDGGGHTDVDTPAVIEMLSRLGVAAVPAVWHDDRVDWSSFDAIVMRSPWDYSRRLTEFDEWMTRAATQTRIYNSPELIRWNLDKRYLDSLRALGVSTIPTVYCTDLSEVTAAVTTLDCSYVVVKPTVSAGSRDTGLFHCDDHNLYDLAEHIIQAGKEVMVQPEIPSLSAGREKAVFYFGGHYSHAITKGPLLARGGGFVNGEYQEVPRPATPSVEELALGDLTMEAIRTLSGDRNWAGSAPPVYARLDVVIDAVHGPSLVEAELFEPSLYVVDNRNAARRYAKAVADRLGRGGR